MYKDSYSAALEAAGMLSPRKAATILATLPEETLIQLGVIQKHEPRKKQRTNTEGNRAEIHAGTEEDTDHDSRL